MQSLFVLSVRDRIRTHDLLVRSQTLYPAELHALKPISATNNIIFMPHGFVKKNYVSFSACSNALVSVTSFSMSGRANSKQARSFSENTPHSPFLIIS